MTTTKGDFVIAYLAIYGGTAEEAITAYNKFSIFKISALMKRYRAKHDNPLNWE